MKRHHLMETSRLGMSVLSHLWVLCSMEPRLSTKILVDGVLQILQARRAFLMLALHLGRNLVLFGEPVHSSLEYGVFTHPTYVIVQKYTA